MFAIKERYPSSLIASDANLLRLNIPEYRLVGFACAAPGADAMAVTIGLVTDLPYPESRPIRVLMSRDQCRELAMALERAAQLNDVLPIGPTHHSCEAPFPIARPRSMPARKTSNCGPIAQPRRRPAMAIERN